MVREDSPTTLTLPGGRRIEYEIFAPPDVPTPRSAIFFFHGSPGSHPEGSVIRSQVFTRHTRLISLSRPGYAGSTLQPNRTILGWPKDVLAVADHLGVEQFYIIAFSGGGPFALACLASIPSPRLLRTAIVSGMWPGRLEKGETLVITRIIHWAAVTPVVSSALPYLLDLAVGRSARNKPKAANFEARFVQDVGSRHPKEAKCLQKPEVRYGFVESTREAFKDGCHGWATEAGLLNGDWHMALGEIDGTRLDVWHGSEDENIPYRLAVEASTDITSCQLHVMDGEAHLSLLANCADSIVGQLLGHASAEHT